jgi:hypothetical protein
MVQYAGRARRFTGASQVEWSMGSRSSVRVAFWAGCRCVPVYAVHRPDFCAGEVYEGRSGMSKGFSYRGAIQYHYILTHKQVLCIETPGIFPSLLLLVLIVVLGL